MTDTMNDEVEMSLADIADFDVSDVQELRSESLPAGAYVFEVKSADLTEDVHEEKGKRFIASFKLEVLECQSVLKRGVDKESLVGKTHTERRYITLSGKPQDDIGYLRTFIKDLGGNNEGKLGDIIAGTVGLTVAAKITEARNKNDPSKPFARLVLAPVK